MLDLSTMKQDAYKRCNEHQQHHSNMLSHLRMMGGGVVGAAVMRVVCIARASLMTMRGLEGADRPVYLYTDLSSWHVCCIYASLKPCLSNIVVYFLYKTHFTYKPKRVTLSYTTEARRGT